MVPGRERPEAHRRRLARGLAVKPDRHPAPGAGGVSSCDDLGIHAEALTGPNRQGDVLVDAPAGGRGADDGETVALVRACDELAGRLDAEVRVARRPPATTAVAVETAVVDEGLVDVNGVDAEARRTRRRRRTGS